MALIEAVQGERRAASNVQTDARAGAYSEIITNDVGLGRYFEINRVGRLYIASTAPGGFSTANATFVAPVAATSTPLIALRNPANSSKALVILKATIGSLPVGPATTVFEPVWFSGPNAYAITAAAAGVTILSASTLQIVAPAEVQGYANAALTGLIAPFNTIRPFAASSTLSGTLGLPAVATEETEGSIIIPPGVIAGILATTAPVAQTNNASIVFASIDWPLA